MTSSENSPEKNNAPVTQTPRTLGEFVHWTLRRIRETRKYWLIPFWILLVALAIVLYLTGNSALLPAIYMAF